MEIRITWTWRAAALRGSKKLCPRTRQRGPRFPGCHSRLRHWTCKGGSGRHLHNDVNIFYPPAVGSLCFSFHKLLKACRPGWPLGMLTPGTILEATYNFSFVSNGPLNNKQDFLVLLRNTLLGRKLGMSNEGWPSQKGCKLISKPHLDTPKRAHRYATKTTTLSNTCTWALSIQWIQTNTWASPSNLRQPKAH